MMKTWNDYKEYVRTVDPETAKDIKETEEVAAIVTAINHMQSCIDSIFIICRASIFLS